MGTIIPKGVFHTPATYGATLSNTHMIIPKGVLRSPLTFGAYLHNPLIVPAEIQAYLHRRVDTTLGEPTFLARAQAPTWQHVPNDTGAASVTLQNSDTDCDLFVRPADCDDFVRFTHFGIGAFTMQVEGYDRTTLAQLKASDQRTKYTGRDHSVVLEDARVYPGLGVLQQPVEQDRVFDASATQFDDSGWTPAHVIGLMGFAKALYALTYPVEVAQGFPDDTAGLLWSPLGTLVDAPEGDVWGRQWFNVTIPGIHTFYGALDDRGSVSIDGVPVGALEFIEQIVKQPIYLSTGPHLVAWHVHNAGPTELFSTNPGYMAWSIYRGSDPFIVPLPVAHSDSSGKILAYPSALPGMTYGRIMNMLLDEAQARGALPMVTRGFTDTRDHAGELFPTLTDVATKVGTDYRTFLIEGSNSFIDWSMPPGSFRLDLWNKGGAARPAPSPFLLPTDSNDLTTHLAMLQHKGGL